MKKVIAYSLWGNAQLYTVNCVRNTELAEKYYPDWLCYVYVGLGVPKGILDVLQNKANTRLIFMNKDGNREGRLWRFYAASESDVEIMISRDTDSLIGPREIAAVNEWLDSGKKFHIMRDHTYHDVKIMAGMWGVRDHYLQNMKQLVDAFLKTNNHASRQIDQDFLAKNIYPIVIENSLVHDPYKRHGHGKEFPIPRNRPWYEETLRGEWKENCMWDGDDNDFIGKLAYGCDHAEYFDKYSDTIYKE